MKKNKLLIMSILLLLFVCGCESNTKESGDDYTISIYTDSVTCVEYLKYHAGYKGGLSVRYNQDGTIKLNEECLNGKKVKGN